MKVVLGIFAAMAVLGVIILGSGYVSARSAANMMPGNQGTQVQTSYNCERNFNTLDSGNKGYLSYWDYKAGTYGTGGHKGLAPSGDAQNRFASADVNRDNLLSKQEYCEWTNRP